MSQVAPDGNESAPQPEQTAELSRSFQAIERTVACFEELGNASGLLAAVAQDLDFALSQADLPDTTKVATAERLQQCIVECEAPGLPGIYMSIYYEVLADLLPGTQISQPQQG